MVSIPDVFEVGIVNDPRHALANAGSTGSGTSTEGFSLSESLSEDPS